MRTPAKPPDFDALLSQVLKGGADRFAELVTGLRANDEAVLSYLPWDKVRYRKPPNGMSHEEWWLLVKMARNGAARTLPLLGKEGRPFRYSLPDSVLRMSEEINRNASGSISISEQVTDPATRDRYLVSSLIEEATTSSQLEGASTTGKVAKEMIRSGRPPRDRSEKMILNNYYAMRRIIEVADVELSPELICEIHRIVTEGTLDDGSQAGRIQRPSDERVAIYQSVSNDILHTPPPAAELPERLQRLCDFANGKLGESYVPPVLRALTIHFMIGYDHPFVDGNGRTARALFYWSMLRQGFWLTEFLTVSRILRQAPSQYARSYLLTQQDDNDLTYFFLYHLRIIERAIDELHEHLARKMREVRDFQKSVAILPGRFNHRQIALLEHGVKNPHAHYTSLSHSSSHRVSDETARKDLAALEKLGLLNRTKNGYAYVWHPIAGLAEKLRSL